MHENGEPASLGTIEVIEAGNLTLGHIGRQVSFPHNEDRIHGRLSEVGRLDMGGMELTVGPMRYQAWADTPVRVIVQTAAEAAAERRAAAKIVEENTP